MTEGTREREAGLSPEGRAALERRILAAAKSAADTTETPLRIVRRPDPAGPAPLSSMQQRLWLLDQLAPGKSSYNVTRTSRVEGPLDLERFAGSLERVVARHEALRTTFASREGLPFQESASAALPFLAVLSLGDLPEDERERAALDAALRDAETPFDLTRGPLLRVTLFRLSRDNHILHLTAHHIITDAWSMEILFQELSAFYSESESVASPPIRPLGLQYADFCAWQTAWLGSERAESQLSYWAERLRGATSLDLPLDRPRPAVPSFSGWHRTILLPRAMLDGLLALALRENATLFMVLLAAFYIFLQRHSGQDDVSVATPIAGRTLPELEPLIGFFANTLVLRGDLSGAPDFREVLRRVRETALDAFSHQEVPLEQLVQTLRPERHLSQNPLAQAFLVLQNAPSGALRFGSARVTPIDLVTRTARFDLELHARETGDGLSCMLIASADLFDEDTVGRFLERFEVLLTSILTNPDLPVSGLALIPAEERRRVLFDWNRTERDFGRPRCIDQLFEEQVARTPDAVAVHAKGAEMTYSELNARANRLSRRLRAAGVVPDALVGVCLERTPDLIVALLGIWKARGAYVALDPSYPAERLKYMLEDSGARVVIAEEELPRGVGGSSVRIAPSSAQTGSDDSGNLEGVANPSSMLAAIRLAKKLARKGQD